MGERSLEHRAGGDMTGRTIGCIAATAGYVGPFFVKSAACDFSF